MIKMACRQHDELSEKHVENSSNISHVLARFYLLLHLCVLNRAWLAW